MTTRDISVPRPVAAASLLGRSDLAQIARADLREQHASRIQGDLLPVLVGGSPVRASGRRRSAEASRSHLESQAYKEIGEDGQPIVVLAGVDIVRILKTKGFGTAKAVSGLLRASYPPR